MDANSSKKPSQLETNDLIAEAVINAEARRNQAEELLSEEELAAVNGGKINLPIRAGMKVNLPIIAGMKQTKPLG
jgi:bacteriocin-like protein